MDIQRIPLKSLSYHSFTESDTSILQSLKKREKNPRDKLVKVLNNLSRNANLDIAVELFGSPTF